MHPGRVGADRWEALRRLYQLPVPNDQLDRHALLNLVRRFYQLPNDQLNHYALLIQVAKGIWF